MPDIREHTPATHPDIRLWPHYEVIRWVRSGGAVIARVYDRAWAVELVRACQEGEAEQASWDTRYKRGAMAVAPRRPR